MGMWDGQMRDGDDMHRLYTRRGDVKYKEKEDQAGEIKHEAWQV